MGLVFRYKKANVGLDAIMVVVVLFMLSVVAVVGYQVLKDTADDAAADPTFNPQANATLQQVTNQYPALMDDAFIFILGLLWILALVASFFVDAHPIFLVLAIIVLMVVVFIGASIENVHAELIDDPDLAASAAAFPKTNWVMDHLLMMILAISISIMLALYGKNKFG